MNTACCICKYTMYVHTIIALLEWVTLTLLAVTTNATRTCCLWSVRWWWKKQFSWALSKLLKATISFMSVRQSSCNNSAPTGRIFMKFDIWVFLEKSVEKIQVALKSDKNNGYFTWTPMYIFTTSRSVLLRMRNISDKRCRKNQNTLFCSRTFFFFFFRKLWPLWDDVEKYYIVRHRWQYDSCILHAVYVGLQIYTQVV